MSRRLHRYAALLAAADLGARSPLRAGGFGCRECGSPAVLLPSDLSAEALVVCDGCQRPVATLADFRAYVGRVAASARFCDHHLTACRSDAGAGPDQAVPS